MDAQVKVVVMINFTTAQITVLVDPIDLKELSAFGDDKSQWQVCRR